jgi:flagellar hook-associated protein 3 FlgL
MIRGVDSRTGRFLTDIGRLQRRSERTQRMLSSGLRVNNPSDDPDMIATLLQVREDLQRTCQIKLNLDRVKTETDTAETALQGAVQLVERVRVLATQGVTDLQSAATRITIAGEVEAILVQLVAVSNSAVEGRFIFSGDSDQLQPYQLDLSQPNGVSPYGGSAATRRMRHPSGVLFPIGKTAEEIFDNPNPASNVFAATNSLRVALLADDTPAIQTALANVTTALTHLNSALASYGTSQSQVDEAVNVAAQMELRLRTQLSEMQEADLTESITELEQVQFHLETAMTVHGSIPRRSLFDFLF